MVVNALDELLRVHPQIETLTDIGCGDGSFLDRARRLRVGLSVSGVDAGRGNVEIARGRGLNVRQGDILDMTVDTQVVTMTEVLEHLVDPHGYLKTLGGKWLIATSPLGESDEWHYEHHSWAWDREGFCDMIKEAGWNVMWWYECIADRTVAFPPSGAWRAPQSQCVVAVRSEKA